ncbi:MAG: hypothetical protein Q7V88_00055 [Actinomycetota bacterium]|nr:hypothetical protein [Actinomycetota bacterium]
MRTSRVCVVAAALLVACGGGGSPLVAPTNAPASGPTTGPVSPGDTGGSGGTAAPTTEAAEPVLTIDEQGMEVVPLSWGGVGAMAAAEATNSTGRYIQSMGYEVFFRDASGAVLVESSGNVFGVPPGGVALLEASRSFDEGAAQPTSVEFVLDPPLLTDGVAFDYSDTGAIDLREIAVEIGEPRVGRNYNENLRAFAVVTNLGSVRLQELPYTCVFRSGGAITGGAIGSIAELLPGGTAGLSAMPRYDAASVPDDVRCTVNPTDRTQLTDPTDRGVEIVGSGFTTATRNYTGGVDALAAVLLHNPGTDVLTDVRVQTDLYDAAGTLIDVGNVFGGYVLPGEEAVFAPIVVPGRDEAAATSMVVGVSVGAAQPLTAVEGIVGSEPFDLSLWTFGVLGAHYEFDGVTSGFVGEVVNPQPVIVNGGLEVTCALLQGGQVVGGQEFSGPESLPASGTAPFDVITTPFGMLPDHDEVRCSVHVNSLFETEPG